MLSGGMAMHMIESFGRHPGFKVVPMHHEQAAGIAANSYGRTLNTTGICMVTAGPGATNAVTPCAGAWMESSPMFFLSGQVSRKNGRGDLAIRQRGIQEVDIVSIVKSITKYAVQISEAGSIRYHLEKALFLATHGRPGPVWLDVPVDIQGALVDETMLQGFDPTPAELSIGGIPVGERLCEQIRERISRAKRPLLVLGQGVRLSGAAPLVQDLVRHLDIPVQTSWNGMDLIPADDPHVFGRANVFGPRHANIILQNSDLLLVIGARLGMQHTGYNVSAFARAADIIMVDLDPAEMEKPGLNISTRIHADAKCFIEQLLKTAPIGEKPSAHADWFRYCRNIRSKYGKRDISQDGYVDPFYFVERFSHKSPDDAVITYGSSGMPHTVFGGNYEIKGAQRAYCFKGLAGMGYGLPCTVGSAFATPGKRIYTLIGEGGLQLNIQELQTIRHFNLPVKIIVFNNGGYHSIRMTQTTFFNRHFVASGPESDVTFPDLEKIAACYGLKYNRVDANERVDEAIAKLGADLEPAFLEVFISPDKALEPKLASYKLPDGSMESRPLEDMVPLLPREELAKDMIIPLIS